MQTFIDNPALSDKLGQQLQTDGVTTPLAYNETGNWWQNQPGEASAVTVWGYLLDENKQPTPDAMKTVRESAAFNLVGPSFLSAGPPKLQMYYIGPRANPILRSTPYNDQGSVFDKVYPGHNETNWWDFYFPGLYAGTTDLLGVHNGEPAIMDYKNTKKMKKKEMITDYFCQGAAYALAHNAVHGTDIAKIVIFMVDREHLFTSSKMLQRLVLVRLILIVICDMHSAQ